MAVVDNLEALLAKGTDNALLRFGLANEYLKLGQSEQAIGHLRKALAHDPKYSAAWKRLGKALADTGRTDEAIAAYESGVRVAEEKGDVQAAKEMRVFLKRLQKQ
ncbi:MAG: tetratricopeptide repeat protein [Pseudomonadota bacterium]